MAATPYLCNCNLHTHLRYVCRATWFNHPARSSACGGSDEHNVFEYLPGNPPRPDPQVPAHPAVKGPIRPRVLRASSSHSLDAGGHTGEQELEDMSEGSHYMESCVDYLRMLGQEGYEDGAQIEEEYLGNIEVRCNINYIGGNYGHNQLQVSRDEGEVVDNGDAQEEDFDLESNPATEDDADVNGPDVCDNYDGAGEDAAAHDMVTADAEDDVERGVDAQGHVAELVEGGEVDDLFDITGKVCYLALFSITEHIYT